MCLAEMKRVQSAVNNFDYYDVLQSTKKKF